MKEGFGKHWRSRWWLAGAVGAVSRGSIPGQWACLLITKS